MKLDSTFYALIITFNPDIVRIQNNVTNLIKQGFRIIVVDNNSSNVEQIEKITNIMLLKLNSNKGIATALNIGMQNASMNGDAWVLSLDQDTEIAPNLLAEYKKVLSIWPNVGALSPQIVKRGENRFITNSDVKKIEKCPTSGFFLNTAVWESLGKYNDWMFIDYVDYDMCIRIRINGYNIYRVDTTYIIQELGKTHVNKLLYGIGDLLNVEKLKNFSVTYNHSPLRNYYYVRNALYYIDNYHDHIDAKYERKHLIKWEIKKLLLESNKMKNIKAIIRAVHDYRGVCKTGY